MRRKRQGSSLEETLLLIITLIVVGGAYKLYQLNIDQTAIFTVLGGFLLLLIFVLLFIAWFFQRRANQRKQSFLSKIRKDGIEQEVSNFINRFGLERSGKNNWGFRDYNFKWDRLEDFRRTLQERGVRVSSNKWEDTLFILRHFIQIKEEKVTRSSIEVVPKSFAKLSGQDFEDLLYRLFTAAGYSVQRTGRSGDQGADLIVSKEHERIAVQAKRYKNSVNNSAIQEAVAAQKMYDCNKSSVVTTSEFTAGAKQLAKANSVELIEKRRLQELLLQFLKESWI